MKNCVTHHFACDCREERFKRIELALRQIMQLAIMERQNPDIKLLDPKEIVLMCQKAFFSEESASKCKGEKNE